MNTKFDLCFALLRVSRKIYLTNWAKQKQNIYKEMWIFFRISNFFLLIFFYTI